MNHTPETMLQCSPARWTTEEILEAYERAKTQPIDVKDYLPSQTGGRYVVVGASGLVGGWIVQHLLMRGESPSAIRMIDIRPNSRPEITNRKVNAILADITDIASTKRAFEASWPADVADKPLTVFHTAAVLDPSNRAQDLLPALARVNVDGTRNVLNAAREAGARVFISTSSATVGLKAPQWFPPLWRYYPKHFIQVVPNANPEKSVRDTRHEEYCGNYAVTKHWAETLVCEADDKLSGFRTGCIRPGNAVYGTGTEDESSVTWRFLSASGYPSWAHPIMQNFANAQNVSIAHLLLESKLLDAAHAARDLGGRAYCVTDPNPPITFGDLYKMLITLAESPVRIPSVPGFPLLCLAHLIEMYSTFQRRHASYLPRITGNLRYCQPAVFNTSTLHLAFDITSAQGDLGYKGPFSTIDGVAADMAEWNRQYATKSHR